LSWLTTEWAAYDAPVKTPTEKLVLTALARHLDDDGCDAYSSKETLGRDAMCDPKTAQRALRNLEARGIIKPGDPKVVEHLDPRRRPRVYDLQIPYSWYSKEQWGRLNAQRVRKGKPPLRPEDRPDLAPAPPRAERSDKGKKVPQRRPKSLGPAPAGLGDEEISARQEESRGDSESISPETRGDYESQPGGIENPSDRDSESPNSLCDSSLDDSRVFLPAVGEVQHRKAIAPSGLRPGNEDHAAEPDAVVRVGDIRAVYASLPDQVRGSIGVEASPRVVDAIRAELATGTRTAAQLVDRVARRWDGWQRLGEQLRDPVGLAVTLVRRRQCPDVECEDGRHLETGRECAACARSRPGRVRPEPVEVPGPRPRPDDRRVAEVLAPVPYVPEAGDQGPARPVSRGVPSGPPPGLLDATRARLHRIRGVHRRTAGSTRVPEPAGAVA